MAASETNVHTTEYSTTVTIPCWVTRGLNDVATIVYKWYRDGEEVGSILGPGSGALVLTDVTQDDRGRYKCVVELTVPGVGGQPLEAIIGAVTVGVGGRHLSR